MSQNRLPGEHQEVLFFSTAQEGKRNVTATVIRPLTEQEADIEEVGPMFKIRLEDGAEQDAFEDELIPIDTLEDEEVVGLDRDGCVLQWNTQTRISENTGEKHEQYGIHNLREHEAPRVGVPEGVWLQHVNTVTARQPVPGKRYVFFNANDSRVSTWCAEGRVDAPRTAYVESGFEATHWCEIPTEHDPRWRPGNPFHVPEAEGKGVLTQCPFYPSGRLGVCWERKEPGSRLDVNFPTFDGAKAWMLADELRGEALPLPDVTRKLQITHPRTGASFSVKEASAADWTDSWPSQMADGLPVSEGPGNINGSVFCFWLGQHTSPFCTDIVRTMTAFIGDHDVAAVRFVRAAPSKVHPAITAAYTQLADRAGGTT